MRQTALGWVVTVKGQNLPLSVCKGRERKVQKCPQGMFLVRESYHGLDVRMPKLVLIFCSIARCRAYSSLVIVLGCSKH